MGHPTQTYLQVENHDENTMTAITAVMDDYRIEHSSQTEQPEDRNNGRFYICGPSSFDVMGIAIFCGKHLPGKTIKMLEIVENGSSYLSTFCDGVVIVNSAETEIVF